MTACHDKKIKKESQDYAHDMNHFWKNLQSDSVAEWGLLKSFACRGIPNHGFQFAAFLLTWIFFTDKLLKLHHRPNVNLKTDYRLAMPGGVISS